MNRTITRAFSKLAARNHAIAGRRQLAPMLEAMVAASS